MQYDENIAAILTEPGAEETLRRIRELQATPCIRAALFLRSGAWKEAHEEVDNGSSPNECYWHAIIHREEPDPVNSAYWFRQVGQHPIFPALRARAAELGVDFGERWNPFRFIEYCEQTRTGSEEAKRAEDVARAEWQLLFDYCYSEGNRSPS